MASQYEGGLTTVGVPVQSTRFWPFWAVLPVSGTRTWPTPQKHGSVPHLPGYLLTEIPKRKKSPTWGNSLPGHPLLGCPMRKKSPTSGITLPGLPLRGRPKRKKGGIQRPIMVGHRIRSWILSRTIRDQNEILVEGWDRPCQGVTLGGYSPLTCDGSVMVSPRIPSIIDSRRPATPRTCHPSR